MKAHQTGHALDNCSTPSTHEAIGRLHRQLGHLSNSLYYYNHTAGFLTNVPSALSNMNFVTTDTISYDSTYVAEQLYYHHPLVIIGGGAAWDIDGYSLHRVTTYIYERVAANINEYELAATIVRNRYLYHYNWCWYGDCNGYFSPAVFNPQSGTTYDGTHLEPSNNFNSSVKLLRFYPNE